MKNKEQWMPAHFKRDAKGRLEGTHMHKIIGYAYEKVIREHALGTLADIGCGSVPYYQIYKDQVAEIICVDWGETATGISHLDFVADLNNGIPLANEVADTVLCTDVLEHIHNPVHLFSEMTRIMKQDAKIIVTVPFLYWIHNAPHDHHRYTRYMLTEFCRKNGLTVVSLEEYGGLPEILYDLVHKGYIFYNFPLRRAFLFSWRKFGEFLYRRNFIVNLSKRSRETFPLGYILVAQKKSIP